MKYSGVAGRIYYGAKVVAHIDAWQFSGTPNTGGPVTITGLRVVDAFGIERDSLRVELDLGKARWRAPITALQHTPTGAVLELGARILT